MKGLLKFVLGLIIVLVVLGILLPIILPVSLIGFSFLAGLVDGILATAGGWKIFAAIGLIGLAIFFFYIAFNAN